jgi:Protein of unknown function (DUF2608)
MEFLANINQYDAIQSPLVESVYSIPSKTEIVEIYHIDEIYKYIKDKENILGLVDIDDTLIDNPFGLGSPPSRNWIKSRISHIQTDFSLYDALTLYIAKNAPYKAVEPTTAQVIADLQKEGHAIFAFTARGRSEWYTTTVKGVDQFTHEQLNAVGINFKNTQVPENLQSLEDTYFNDGIIFAKHISKGELLTHLFKDLNYTPSLIVFVDDKRDQVESVKEAALKAGIPFIGFWYRRSEIDRINFDPMVANVQLESLLLKNEILTDEAAKEIAMSKQNVDPESYLHEIFEKIDINMLRPVEF